MAATDDKLAATPTQGRQARKLSLRADELSAAERLARTLAGKLAGELSRRLGTAAHISPAGFEVAAYCNFLASLHEPACCWLLSCPAGPSWLELSAVIAKALAAILLDGRADAAGRTDRPPTSVERRLLAGFVDCVNRAVAQAAGLTADDAAHDAPAEGNERQMLVASFTIQLPGAEGAMRLGLPRELCRPASDESPAPEPAEAEADLSAEIAEPTVAEQAPEEPAPPIDGPVELSVAAPETTIAPDELALLAPGDVLVTDADADGEVFVYVAGRKRFAAKLGSRNGKRAITIIRQLDEPQQDTPPAE